MKPNLVILKSGEMMAVFSDNFENETMVLVSLDQLEENGTIDAEFADKKLYKYSEIEL